MKIGVIQASSQAVRNSYIFETVRRFAPNGSEVINFGCTLEESNKYSYVDISILIGLLLESEAVDFVVTGCSSGQGMMLACNSMPGVLCGYAPTPKDAYLFAQINNGNSISLPLGEEYTWAGEENFEKTIELLFSELFGQGYPKGEADRKLKDTERLKVIRKTAQLSPEIFLKTAEPAFFENCLKKKDVVTYILNIGNEAIKTVLKSML
ncbi:MAG: RpiB/LacA/LacB family sugar-phosphate isomerase [Lachnospiraceae bacterium]|nr:RpiB/LacA/LacB family sugar-phosphate isomerase [Lachnospiraceae bacterium]